MVELGEALQVVEARDLVAGVQAETAGETMVPQDNLWLKGNVQHPAMPFTPVEMKNSLKDTCRQQTRF